MYFLKKGNGMGKSRKNMPSNKELSATVTQNQLK